jgi:hypothetical protein
LALTGDMLAEDPSCVHQPVAGAPLVEPPHATAYGMSASPPRTLVWSAEAESRMKRVPSFVRGVVMRRLEEFARERGATEITVDLLRDVREAMPVDFSRRRPFFLDED